MKNLTTTLLLAAFILIANFSYAQTTSKPKPNTPNTRPAQIEQSQAPAPESKAPAKFIESEMVLVEGGTFMMGCSSNQQGDCMEWEKPAHRVTVNSFSIGKYEVTQAQWKAIMGNSPSHFKGDKLPVENVSWEEVQQFISKLNAKTGKQYRLPTEAEWEFAARGGNMSKGYKYSGSNNVETVAWHAFNSEDKTHAVGTKSPNELGIYDMSGNVYEWCNDWYSDYSNGAQTNPQGPASGSFRVGRGGSWSDFAARAGVSNRIFGMPNDRDFGIGFRLACNAK